MMIMMMTMMTVTMTMTMTILIMMIMKPKNKGSEMVDKMLKINVKIVIHPFFRQNMVAAKFNSENVFLLSCVVAFTAIDL